MTPFKVTRASRQGVRDSVEGWLLDFVVDKIGAQAIVIWDQSDGVIAFEEVFNLKATQPLKFRS